MITWTTLCEQLATSGLTVDITRETRTLIETPSQPSLSAEKRNADLRARIEILQAVKQYLDNGHTECGASGNGKRHYIARHDVVVTGPTNDDGVPIKCNDPICRAWYRRDEEKLNEAG